MAYTLNTSHPLYGNLIELIGVQSGALVSHKTARTFTKDAAASYGTGSLGEYFATAFGGNYSPQGASFTPAISTDGTAHGITVFYVVESIDATSAQGGMLSGNSGSAYRIPSVGVNAAGQALITAGFDTYAGTGTTDVLGSGPHTLSTTRQAGAQTSTSATLYVDGVLEATGGSGINEVTTGHTIDYIGGTPGQVAVAYKLVWMVVFDKILSVAEELALHNSIGANNTFGLVSSGSAGDATAPAANVTGTGSISAGVATGGSGSTGSFTFPAGENNTHSGVLSGVAVNWAWHSGGSVGAATTITNGSGAMTTAGMTISGLPLGAGYGILRSTDGTVVGYREGTAA